MAQNTKQDTAIGMANELCQIVTQIQSLRARVEAFNVRNTTLSPDTIWRQMATAAKNADGSQGAADGTPVLADPITVGGIDRAEADLLTGLTLVIEFDQFVSGTLPTNRAAIDRRPIIDILAG